MPKPRLWPRLRHFSVSSADGVAHLDGHLHRARGVVRELDRRVEQDHHAVAGIAVERAFVLEDQFAKRCVIFAQHVHRLFRLGGLGERRKAAQVAEHHRDFAAVAVEQAFMAVGGGDQLRHLRRQKTLQLPDALDLAELCFHPLFQRAVPVLQLVGLLLQLVGLLAHGGVRGLQVRGSCGPLR